MKKLLFVILSMCSVNIHAQDVIVKKDGSTILSKVLEVNTADIKYKKFSNQNGPTYTISKAEVMTINYENGDKDDFASGNVNVSQPIEQVPRLISKPADKRNAEIISLYNRYYNPTKKVDKKNSLAKYYLLIFGIKSSSIMSNEDIEMKFVREVVKSPYGRKYTIYNINLTNKTNKTLYIDKGNCFKLYNNGEFLCYFDNTEQMTVNMGGGSGASLGLGSVAGALGIGGTVGQLASGVGVGGGSSHSVSTTYSQQRVIAIPPHGNRNLTDEKWVKTKKGSLFSDAEYTTVEDAESFNFEYVKSSELGLRRGMVKRGEVLTYQEDESPWKREYIITYSTDESFNTYSSIKSELYIHEIIGCQSIIWNDEHHEKYIDGLNEYTIEGYHWTDKK